MLDQVLLLLQYMRLRRHFPQALLQLQVLQPVPTLQTGAARMLLLATVASAQLLLLLLAVPGACCCLDHCCCMHLHKKDKQHGVGCGCMDISPQQQQQ
jgi:hypothetical protein